MSERISGAMMPAAPSIAHRAWMTSLYLSQSGLMKPPEHANPKYFHKTLGRLHAKTAACMTV